jgi:hypothetical protein
VPEALRDAVIRKGGVDGSCDEEEEEEEEEESPGSAIVCLDLMASRLRGVAP